MPDYLLSPLAAESRSWRVRVVMVTTPVDH
jgi:hypothetical protein